MGGGRAFPLGTNPLTKETQTIPASPRSAFSTATPLSSSCLCFSSTCSSCRWIIYGKTEQCERPTFSHLLAFRRTTKLYKHKQEEKQIRSESWKGFGPQALSLEWEGSPPASNPPGPVVSKHTACSVRVLAGSSDPGGDVSPCSRD